MATIDQNLLNETIRLDVEFQRTAIKLNATKDTRVFFTWAHGYITRKIWQCIDLFNNPNSLMSLNRLFANDFLRAINGAPHGKWGEAFQICKNAMDIRQSSFAGSVMYAAGSFQGCAACMAKVHISQDLKNALVQVRDVDPQDYGNILIPVNEGHMYAEKMLRGGVTGARTVATLSVMAAFAGGSKLRMSAELWRNEAFEASYGQKVPKPSPEFAQKYRERCDKLREARG